MGFTVEIIESKLFIGAVADEIVASLNEAFTERGRASFVLSGGKTPGSIYRALTKPPRLEEINWGALRLFWGDERWVPHSDSQSNFRLADETLVNAVRSHGPKLFPIDTSLASPQEGARAYAELIRREEGLRAGERPQFDLVLLGMGTDGHTASLFPGQKHEPSELVTVAKGPDDGLDRISLSAEAIIGARRIIYIVSGDAKSMMLKRVLEGEESEEVLPARLFTRAKGSVTWMVDSAASSKLERYR